MATPALSVYPNPFHLLDHEGHPAGTTPYDPEHAPGARRWVGASLCPVRTKILKSKHDQTAMVRVGGVLRKTHVNAAPMQRTVFNFDLEAPSVVLSNKHYKDEVANGSLLPATADDAAKCGLKAFVPPMDALAAAAAKCVADWQRDHGSPPNVDGWAPNLKALLPSAPVKGASK